MSLAEELAKEVYLTMPVAMPCNSVFAVALVNAALGRAAQECEVVQMRFVGLRAQAAARECVDRIRALQDTKGI